MSAIIRVFDFETSGLEEQDEVVEAAYCDLSQDGERWAIAPPVSWLCGITVPIHPQARGVHHIGPEDLEGLAPFDPVTMRDANVTVYAAHFAEFDRKFFDPQAPLICTWKAALRVFPDAPSHGNQALRYWLEDQGLIRVDPALAYPPHRAGPDTYVTACVLQALLMRATGRQMVAWTREPALLPRCPIGDPWRGKRWSEVDAGFLDWMIRKPVEPDLVWNAKRELERRRSGEGEAI